MDRNQEIFEAVEATIKAHYSNFKVIPKETSGLHKFIGAVLKPTTPTYMTEFWTTIGATVAYPKESTPGEHYKHWAVLPHEGIHAGQSKKWSSGLFGMLYLLGTPVYLIPFFLVGLALLICSRYVVDFPWWPGVAITSIGVLLSCPVPFAYWRYRWEIQGYWVSMAVWKWTGNSFNDYYYDQMTQHFTTGEYFFMWPFKSYVNKKLRALSNDLDGLLKHPTYGAYMTDIYATLKEHHCLIGQK